jgi:uncharacterized RDD family membrane protein YckC
MSDTTIIYAGFWKRLAAYIIDALILIVPIFIIGFVIGYFSISLAETKLEMEVFSAGAQGITRILSIVVSWIYFAAMESSSKQGSLGKMALGIKVTDYNGEKISFAKASGRFFGKILSGIIIGIGFLMVAFTSKKQGLHDIMAGTLVKVQFREVVAVKEKIISEIEFEPISQEYQYTKQEKFVKKNGENPEKIGNTFSGKTTVQKPSSQSTNNISKMKEKIDITVNENELYNQIWTEIEENKTDFGLWAKCFAKCEGDENKTKALYVNKRILVLKEELKKQKIDQERKIKKESEKETVKKLLVAKGKTDNMEIFKETLDTIPNFFPKILDKFGYKLVQNQDRQEMWSLHLPSGTGVQYVYNLYDLRTEIRNILENSIKAFNNKIICPICKTSMYISGKSCSKCGLQLVD